MKNIIGIIILPFAMIYVIAGLIVLQIKVLAKILKS